MFESIYDGYLRHKRQYRVFITCTTVSLLLLSVCFAVLIGCERLVENELKKDYTYREAEITMISGEMEELLNCKEWKSYMDDGRISSVQIMQSVVLNAQDAFFRFYDGETTYVFQSETVLGMVPTYATFSQAKIDFFREGIVDFNGIIAGREFEPEDTASVILSERTAFELGFLNLDEILGRKVEIDLGEKTLDVKIIGVAAAQLCDEKGITEMERQQQRSLLEGKCEELSEEYNQVKENSIVMKNYFSADVIEEIATYRMDADDIRTVIRISVDRAGNTVDVMKEINEIVGNKFFLSGKLLQLFSVMEAIKKITNIMISLTMVLVVLTLLNLYCVLFMVSDKQKKSFALKHILGFSKKKICNMYCMEIGIATIKAVFISFVLGILVCKTTDMMVMHVYKSRIHIQSGLITFPVMFFLMFACLFWGAGWCIAYRNAKVVLNETSIEILEK